MEKDKKPLFSILIPTWNNLGFLKLCVESIEKNSAFAHQIIVYVNDGSDGTLDYVKEKGIDYVHSPSNVGICFALNALRPLVKTDYILYMNDDMYVCPQWDKYLWDEIVKMEGGKMWFLSATLIQPRPFFSKSVIAPANYGESVEEFDEERLLAEYDKLPHHDWLGATWPPNVVHRDTWDLVGGYSVELSPGMYSDPDFSAKLWLAGVRLFKGVSKSRVYHFEARSTGRIVKNNGSAQFLLKYGITSATFMKYVLHRDEPFPTWGGQISTDKRQGNKGQPYAQQAEETVLSVQRLHAEENLGGVSPWTKQAKPCGNHTRDNGKGRVGGEKGAHYSFLLPLQKNKGTH